MATTTAPTGANLTRPCDKPGSLLLATRRLLERDTRTREQLALDLGISYHWLNAFTQGVIKAPSVNRVQFIYESLAGSKIIF